jgi:GT2 family glycosyltransferase
MKQNKAKIDSVIVIPTLNLLDLLKGTLESIRMSEPYGIVVIDNNSTDKTEDFMKKESKKKNVVYFRAKTNLGASGSWNAGIEIGAKLFNASKFFIVNNDIIFHPKTLDILSKALDRKDVFMATAFDVSGKCAVPEEIFKFPLPKTGIEKNTPDFSCFSIKKETIQRVGMFDEGIYPAYFEDNDFHYRMKLEGMKAHCLHDCPYFHYGSRSMKISKEFKDYLGRRYAKNREYFERKWGGRPGKEKWKVPFDGKPPKELEIPEKPPEIK